jgi:RNA polymerase sigma-70 factor (ECF subfamily)
MLGRRKKADQDLFESLLVPQLEAGYRFAVQLTRNEADAEDLLQEACRLAYEKFHLFERGTHFKAWFFQIIRHRHIDLLRRKARQPALDDLRRELPTIEAAPDFSDQSAHPEQPAEWAQSGAIDQREIFYDLFGDEVNRFLNELPAEFRAPLLLCDIDGFSYQEIASILGCPIGTVRSRISRARSQLKGKLYLYAKSLGYVRTAAP